jgi:hypothetical protein
MPIWRCIPEFAKLNKELYAMRNFLMLIFEHNKQQKLEIIEMRT